MKALLFALFLWVTPAAAQWSMLTQGSSAVSAFTTFNPSDHSATIALSGGNLVMSLCCAAIGDQGARATTGQSAGKYYYEGVAATNTGGDGGIGLSNAAQNLTTCFSGPTGCFVLYPVSGNIYNASGTMVCSACVATSPTVAIGVATDLTNRKIWFRNASSGLWNGGAIGVQNPATNTGGLTLSTLNATVYPMGGLTAGGAATSWTFNFGATTFALTVPSGFVGWPGP